MGNTVCREHHSYSRLHSKELHIAYTGLNFTLARVHQGKMMEWYNYDNST